MKEEDVINDFVAYLGGKFSPGLKVERCPDKENRETPDIDAIAGHFAIEHTSIDTVQNQRRDADWFFKVVGGIKEESHSISIRLTIILEYDAVKKGQDWANIRQNLITWINNEAMCLPDGRSILNNVQGIPFQLLVFKASNRPQGIFFARFEPQDNNLIHRLEAQINRKALKLLKYSRSEYKRVLLVENNDIALMNKGKMMHVIQMAHPKGLPSGVDEIWYADTSIQGDIEFFDLTF